MWTCFPSLCCFTSLSFTHLPNPCASPPGPSASPTPLEIRAWKASVEQQENIPPHAQRPHLCTHRFTCNTPDPKGSELKESPQPPGAALGGSTAPGALTAPRIPVCPLSPFPAPLTSSHPTIPAETQVPQIQTVWGIDLLLSSPKGQLRPLPGVQEPTLLPLLCGGT